MNKQPVDNPMPEWSLMMFWEDITAIIQKIFDMFREMFA